MKTELGKSKLAKEQSRHHWRESKEQKKPQMGGGGKEKTGNRRWRQNRKEGHDLSNSQKAAVRPERGTG